MTSQSVKAQFLTTLFNRAVRVADPMEVLAQHLPEKPSGRVVVVGAGKASARMAETVEKTWGPCEGLVITRYGHSRPRQGIEIVEASHPVTDEAGIMATKKIREILTPLGEDDFVLTLISGGASSLLCEPAGKITLDEVKLISEALLASGAPIDKINTLRKHLSCIKGGQLARAAFPARMLTLIISDVPGDDPAFIGSGPTVGDDTSARDALAIATQWNIKLPQNALDVLNGQTGVVPVSDPCLSKVTNTIIAAPFKSLQAAAHIAQQHGCNTIILGDAIEGEARDVAQSQSHLAVKYLTERKAGDAPILLLSGGELTVTRKGRGVGGPNVEFLLALAIALEKNHINTLIYALACDTDGIDGGAEVAGAIITPGTLEKAKLRGLSPVEMLNNNDSHSFFEAMDDQVITGPTLTNVNDFRAILIA